MDVIELTPGIHVGMSQPDRLDFARLAEQGYRTIIDLRSETEEHLLSPTEEKEAALMEGMNYRHFPLTVANLDTDTADRFRQVLEDAETPVLVHCKAGIRCTAFSMMHVATAQNFSAQETLRQAAEMGFDCNSPFWLFAGRYVDRLRKS